MELQVAWHKILNDLKSQIPAHNFKTWFSQTSLKEIRDDRAVINVPHAFIGEQLKTRYLNLLENMLSQIFEKNLSVEFKVDGKVKTQDDEDIFIIDTPRQNTSNLNPKYTLENFVVGLSNNVAFAAAEAIVQNPGTSYNPLYIYGGTGVGKTHLMLGIGNALLFKNPSLKVIYCPSEKFMNDYVEAIQNHRMVDFRAKYRSADALLIDDIQFFSGREGTQEEFFHTFNELQSKNSQMVFTSDRIPQEIAKLEDRLKSRFAGGLMVDIQPPDFDTRVAILKAKCRERGTDLPEEALKLLASLEINIRELEGKLVQILQTLKTQNLESTIENIKPLMNARSVKPASFDHRKVLSTVCGYFDLKPGELTGPNRQRRLVLPRHIAMYILCEDLSMTVAAVGQFLGKRDHTTVMHGRDRIKNLILSDLEIQKIMIDIKQKLIS